jgi:hypothetical protein
MGVLKYVRFPPISQEEKAVPHFFNTHLYHWEYHVYLKRPGGDEDVMLGESSDPLLTCLSTLHSHGLQD